MEASFSKQLRVVQERERSAGLAMERRLREEGEVAQRLSARNNDMQARTGVYESCFLDSLRFIPTTLS